MLLLERLELYVSAGLPIDKAVEISADGLPGGLARGLYKVKRAVESGGSVARACVEHLGMSDMLAGIIAHGESGGGLGQAFGAARMLMERADELRKKCTSAMAYPIVIGIFSGLLTLGLMHGVMPQIIPMLRGLHVELPLITRITIAVSQGFLTHGIFLGLFLLCSAAGFVFSYKRSGRFRYAMQSILMHVPIVRHFIYEYSLSIFMRSCGVLVESGLPIEQAFSRSAEALPLLPLRGKIQSHMADISQGVSLHKVCVSLHTPSYIPPLLYAGESSGMLGASLMRVAAILDRDIEHALKRLTALIEPVLMAAMGIVVGGIALSIMMPIYDISKVLQK